MALIKLSKKYHCYNDCIQSGCPGHMFKIEFHSVTDNTRVYSRYGKCIDYDPIELNCLIDLLKELASIRADSPVKFK